MKEYINYFYFVVDKTKNWKEIDKLEKSKIVKSILIIDNNSHKIVDYIEKYRFFLTNNSLNSLSKSVIDVQI